MKTCENCQFFWYLSQSFPDVPYPEFACTKGHWDGVEDPETILEETDCKDHKFKEK